MYRSFESHIRPILDIQHPKTLLEIGVLRGDNTLKLLEWCSLNEAHLTSLDPVAWDGDLPEEIKRPMDGYKYKRGQVEFESWKVVPDSLEEVFRRGLNQYWTCLKMRSLDYLALAESRGFDTYFIDGDHNYFTVTRELQFIHERGRTGDVILFNDVVGGWARHDQYYDPEFIPDEERDGSKQGVLTAIESFLDSISEKWLWRRRNCPYKFRILTKKNDGIAALFRVN